MIDTTLSHQGDSFFTPPGHLPIIGPEGVVMVEFSQKGIETFTEAAD